MRLLLTHLVPCSLFTLVHPAVVSIYQPLIVEMQCRDPIPCLTLILPGRGVDDMTRLAIYS